MPPIEPSRVAPDAHRPVTAWSFSTEVDAPVVIAVHDFTANGLWFGDLAAAVRKDLHLAAPDLRGRGASVAAPAPATLADHVSDLCGVADALDAATFSVVGHGTGAVVALAAAVAAPSRVAQVTLLDGPPAPTGRPGEPWARAAALVDPGVARLGRTWAHRSGAVADALASGRIPETGMTRALRRAVDAETTGSGFGWRPRLSTATLTRDWMLLEAWTPPEEVLPPVVAFHATHGHRVDDPPLGRRHLEVPTHPLTTTHTGMLVDPDAVKAVTAALRRSAGH